MKTIKIRIPDNLSPDKEAFQIGKQLAKKALSGGGQNKDVKRLGDQLDVIDLKTIIEVERYSTEKPIIMQTCNVCGCEYQSDIAKHYYHNYGGKKTKRAVCSEQCVQFMCDTFGPRVSTSAKKLKPVINNYFQ